MYKYAVVSEKMQFSYGCVFKQLLCIASWPLVKIVLCIQVFAISMQNRHLMQTIFMNKSRKFGKEILSHFREITLFVGDIFYRHPV